MCATKLVVDLSSIICLLNQSLLLLHEDLHHCISYPVALATFFHRKVAEDMVVLDTQNLEGEDSLLVFKNVDDVPPLDLPELEPEEEPLDDEDGGGEVSVVDGVVVSVGVVVPAVDPATVVEGDVGVANTGSVLGGAG